MWELNETRGMSLHTQADGESWEEEEEEGEEEEEEEEEKKKKKKKKKKGRIRNHLKLS